MRRTRSASTVPSGRRLGVVAATAALLASLMSAFAAPSQAQAAAATCTPSPVVCPAAGIYFGASMHRLPTDLDSLQAFGATVGKQPTVANYFAAFGDQLNVDGMTALAANKRLPMVTWSPDVAGNTGLNPYPLTSIAAGAFDTYLTRQAKALATVPGRVVVRFAHEMNGGWFPWGRGVNGNTDAQYVAAYRHVHDVVTAAGATNVLWDWSPAATTTPAKLATLYPGAGYVDWVGPDVYLDHPKDTLAAIWPGFLDDLNTFAGDKPIFVSETGVLPGDNRPAQITDLVSGLLHTPRLVGIAWFEEPGRYDWRVEGDTDAVAALAKQLSNPWFAKPGATGLRLLPPLSQELPVITGDPTVGNVLTSTRGGWRSSKSTGGVATLTSHWYRCRDAVATSSCVAVGNVNVLSYTPTAADWHSYLRLRTHAANNVGSADAWSSAVGLVMATPATPAAPAVMAAATSMRVTFPQAPFGATHWLLTIDGRLMVPIPVSTATYWLTGLTAGHTYGLTLAAADITASGTLVSMSVQLTAAPMTGPTSPYLVVTGSAATFRIPAPPAGAAAYLLTSDGLVTKLDPVATTWTSPPLVSGVAHTWSLAPANGSGGPDSGGGWGTIGAASQGTFTTVDTPAAPVITPIPGGATFLYPALPAGATAWRLTVGPTTYPDTTATSSTVTGLASGYSASWSLRAVNAGARSDAVTGRFTPA